MSYSIDEIYDMLTWDTSLTEEDNLAKEKQGIREASKLKNLYPFIQPVVFPPEKSKAAWEACAKIIAMKNDEELMPYMNLLFEWLQDINWPGALIIFDRLLEIPFDKIETWYNHTKSRAMANDDQLWLMALDCFYSKAH